MLHRSINPNVPTATNKTLVSAIQEGGSPLENHHFWPIFGAIISK